VSSLSIQINAGLNVGVSSQVPCWDFCDKTSGEVPRLAPSAGSTDQTFDKTVTVKSPNKPSCESDQVITYTCSFGYLLTTSLFGQVLMYISVLRVETSPLRVLLGKHLVIRLLKVGNKLHASRLRHQS
jgi:hypothetical protein